MTLLNCSAAAGCLPHMRRRPELLARKHNDGNQPKPYEPSSPRCSGRQASSIRSRRKAAGFPTGKTFDVWDETLSSIPAPTQRSLRTLEWVGRAENLVVCGPSRHHANHFLEGLGHAIDAGHKVSWFSLEDLGALVRPSRRQTARSPKRSVGSCRRCHRDRRHRPPLQSPPRPPKRSTASSTPPEKQAIALSGNLHPASFDELMPFHRQRHRGRLMHHAHIVLTNGDSIRLTQATAGKGVTPLN
ncbi:MAG: ATP-binding protein [Acidimicrobiales bacterium]